jgi:tetratricopeptide (TPR) repeat protein
MEASMKSVAWVVPALALCAGLFPVVEQAWRERGVRRVEDVEIAYHLRRGDEALARRDYAGARMAYREALRIRPHPDHRTRLRRVEIMALAADPSQLQDDRFDALRYRAEMLIEGADATTAAACHTLLGHIALRTHGAERAMTLYDQATASDATYAPAQVYKAVLLQNQGERERAMAGYEAALAADPDHAGALGNLGALYAERGDFERAVPLLQRATERRDSATARLRLGEIYVKRKQPDLALLQLRRAAQLDPRSVEAHQALGTLLVTIGSFEEATRSLRSALTLKYDVKTALTLAELSQRLGRPDEALALLDEVRKQNPRFAEVHGRAAESLEALGRRDEALRAYAQFIETAPGSDVPPARVAAAQARVERLRRGGR